MTIDSQSAQVRVLGTAYINIDQALSGFGAVLTMPPDYQKVYVCRRADDCMIRLFLVNDQDWKGDIEYLGYTVVGELSEMVKEADHDD